MKNNILLDRLNKDSLSVIFPKEVKSITDTSYINLNFDMDKGGFSFRSNPFLTHTRIIKSKINIPNHDKINLFTGLYFNVDSNGVGELTLENIKEIDRIRYQINTGEINEEHGTREEIQAIVDQLYNHGWINNKNILKAAFGECNLKYEEDSDNPFVDPDRKGMVMKTKFDNLNVAKNFANFIATLDVMFEYVADLPIGHYEGVDNSIYDYIPHIKRHIMCGIKNSIILSVYSAKFKEFRDITSGDHTNILIDNDTVVLLGGIIASGIHYNNFSTYNMALLNGILDINKFVDFMLSSRHFYPIYNNYERSLLTFSDQKYIVARYINPNVSSSMDNNVRTLTANDNLIATPTNYNNGVFAYPVKELRDVINIPKDREMNLMNIDYDYDSIINLVQSDLELHDLFTALVITDLHLTNPHVAVVETLNFMKNIVYRYIDFETKKFKKGMFNHVHQSVRDIFEAMVNKNERGINRGSSIDRTYEARCLQSLYRSGIKSTHVGYIKSISRSSNKISEAAYYKSRTINIILDILVLATRTENYSTALRKPAIKFRDYIQSTVKKNIDFISFNSIYYNNYGSNTDRSGSVDDFIREVTVMRNVNDYITSNDDSLQFMYDYEFVKKYKLESIISRMFTSFTHEKSFRVMNILYKIGLLDIEMKRVRLFKYELGSINGCASSNSSMFEIRRSNNVTKTYADFRSNDTPVEDTAFMVMIGEIANRLKLMTFNEEVFVTELERIVENNIDLFKNKVKLLSRTTVYGDLMETTMTMCILSVLNRDEDKFIEVINRLYNNDETIKLTAMNSSMFSNIKYSAVSQNLNTTIFNSIKKMSCTYPEGMLLSLLSIASISDVLKYIGSNSNQNLHNVFSSKLGDEFIDRVECKISNTETLQYIMKRKYSISLFSDFLRIITAIPKYKDFSLVKERISLLNPLKDVYEDIIKNEVIPMEYKNLIGMSSEDVPEKKLDIVDVVPSEGNYRIHFHSHNDDTVIRLGNITNCCQVIGGGAENCIIEGVLNPYSGFISYRNTETNSIVAQSWIWLTHDGNTLVIDSVESRYNDKVDIITRSLLEWAKEQKYNIAIGRSFSKINNDIMKSEGYTAVSSINILNIKNNNPNPVVQVNVNGTMLDVVTDNLTKDDNDVYDYLTNVKTSKEIEDEINKVRCEIGPNRNKAILDLSKNDAFKKMLLRAFSVKDDKGDMFNIYSDAETFYFIKNPKQK